MASVDQASAARSTSRYMNGEQYRISVQDEYRHPEFDARIDVIRVATDEVWTFDVSNGVAHLQTTNAGSGLTSLPELPEWVDQLVRELDIEEVAVP
ncbi:MULTISPECIES: hypothetical protein [Salinibaculum]|uniref:hypothetical protein n=1 Tax=Salinibaculum TaxID=2732368 RepID=UPI0030D54E47